jgi:hypothetical protein
VGDVPPLTGKVTGHRSSYKTVMLAKSDHHAFFGVVLFGCVTPAEHRPILRPSENLPRSLKKKHNILCYPKQFHTI